MAETTLKRLAERHRRAKAKRRENWQEAQYRESKYWNYAYLSREKKEFIDNLTTEHLIRLLEEREYVVVGWALGVIADMWLKVHLLA